MCGPTFIFDTSCLRFLKSQAAREGLTRQVSFTQGYTVATIVNLIEITRHKSAAARAQLRDTVTFLKGARPLLPWPYGLLESVGHALIANDSQFELKRSDLEDLLFEDPTPKTQQIADTLVDGMESDFIKIQDDGRPKVQKFIKEHGLRGAWAGAREFLDEMWMRPSHIDDYVIGVWERNGLPEPCPVEEVKSNPTWRAFFEAYGVAAYEQAILPDRRRAFGMLDLLQLTYPTGFNNGAVFVTNDGPLADAGQVVISEVVPGARVMRWHDFAEF